MLCAASNRSHPALALEVSPGTLSISPTWAKCASAVSLPSSKLTPSDPLLTPAQERRPQLGEGTRIEPIRTEGGAL